MAEESMTTELRVDVGDSIKILQDYFRMYREGGHDVKQLNKEMREITSGMYGARRALSAMRTEWKLQHAAWIEGARVMRDIGRMGRTLVSIWQAYTIGSLRVEQAQLGVSQAQENVRKATLSVSEAQERYNRYLEVFGEDSIYTKNALDALNDAIDAEKKSLEDLEQAEKSAKKAQDDMAKGNITFALSFATVGAEVVTAIGHLAQFKNTLMLLKPTIIAVKGAITALGVTGAAALIGLPALAAGAALGFSELIKATTPPEVLEAYKEAKETVGIFPRGGVIAKEAARIYPEITRRMEEASGAARGYTRILGGGQFGIPYVPETGLYRLERGEEVRRSGVARGITVRQVRITQYIGNVSSDYDVDRLAREAYRKFMRKMEAMR